MKFINGRVATIAAAAVALTVLGGVGGAVAGDLVTSRDIKNDTVRSVDVKDETLRLADLRPGARAALAGQDGADGADGVDGEDGTDGVDGVDGKDGAPGAAGADGKDGIDGIDGEDGADGADGEDGAPGADGADGVSGYEVLNREARLSNTTSTVTVPCSDGKVATGGGFVIEGIRGGDADVKASQPVYVAGDATGWAVTAVATGEANVKAWVNCAAVTR